MNFRNSILHLICLASYFDFFHTQLQLYPHIGEWYITNWHQQHFNGHGYFAKKLRLRFIQTKQLQNIIECAFFCIKRACRLPQIHVKTILIERIDLVFWMAILSKATSKQTFNTPNLEITSRINCCGHTLAVAHYNVVSGTGWFPGLGAPFFIDISRSCCSMRFIRAWYFRLHRSKDWFSDLRTKK